SIFDTGAHIAALTVAQISGLQAKGISIVSASDNVLALSVAQYQAFGAVALDGNNTITLFDTGAHLAALTTAQLAALAGKGIDIIDASDNVLSLTVAQYQALGTVELTAADTVTLADTGANLAALTAAQIAALAGAGIDIIDASDDVLSLTVAQYLA